MATQTHGLQFEGGSYLLQMHAGRPDYEVVRCLDMRAEATAVLTDEYRRLVQRVSADTLDTVVSPRP